MALNRSDSTKREGLNLLVEFKNTRFDLPIIMITAYGHVEIAVDAMKKGAADFIQKPQLNIMEIKTRVSKALGNARLFRRVEELERDISLVEPRQIIGESNGIKEIKKTIRALSELNNSSMPILIRGETGTGKELVARAIHANGIRRDGPFIPVVLSAIPFELIESQLFGHEPGAFTGASKTFIGQIQRADKGILFLDEIGDIPNNIQIKLLRFLEEREFTRLGGTSTIKIDTQIVAATNADLRQS